MYVHPVLRSARNTSVLVVTSSLRRLTCSPKARRDIVSVPIQTNCTGTEIDNSLSSAAAAVHATNKVLKLEANDPLLLSQGVSSLPSFLTISTALLQQRQHHREERGRRREEEEEKEGGGGRHCMVYPCSSKGSVVYLNTYCMRSNCLTLTS